MAMHHSRSKHFILPICSLSQKIGANEIIISFYNSHISTFVFMNSIITKIHHVKFIRHLLPTYISVVCNRCFTF